MIQVWPDRAPGDYGDIDEEVFRPPWTEEANIAKWLTNVTRPTLTVYRPAKEKDTGAAMLICPGGGYWNLAWDLEGEEVAEWLNSIGVTGLLLKYRVPRRPGQPEKQPAPLPLLDAQRAVSLARSKAGEWGIAPNRIGMVGFSAGGHLVMATATNFDRRAYDPLDDVDKVSCRPDFAVAVYSGYLAVEGRDVLAPNMRVPAGTPPVFLVHAGDDSMSKVEHSVVMYLALKRAGISAELHVYSSGGHGFGVRTSGEIGWSDEHPRGIGHESTGPKMRSPDLPCCTWTARCADWLRYIGVLRQNAADNREE